MGLTFLGWRGHGCGTSAPRFSRGRKDGQSLGRRRASPSRSKPKARRGDAIRLVARSLSSAIARAPRSSCCVMTARALALYEAPFAGPLYMVAPERRRQRLSRRTRVADPALEWKSAAGRHGRRLEKAGLRWDEVGVVIPRQPG